MKNINCQVRPVTHIIDVPYDHLNCNTRKKNLKMTELCLPCMQYGRQKMLTC